MTGNSSASSIELAIRHANWKEGQTVPLYDAELKARRREARANSKRTTDLKTSDPMTAPLCDTAEPAKKKSRQSKSAGTSKGAKAPKHSVASSANDTDVSADRQTESHVNASPADAIDVSMHDDTATPAMPLCNGVDNGDECESLASSDESELYNCYSSLDVATGIHDESRAHDEHVVDDSTVNALAAEVEQNIDGSVVEDLI